MKHSIVIEIRRGVQAVLGFDTKAAAEAALAKAKKATPRRKMQIVPTHVLFPGRRKISPPRGLR